MRNSTTRIDGRRVRGRTQRGPDRDTGENRRELTAILLLRGERFRDLSGDSDVPQGVYDKHAGRDGSDRAGEDERPATRGRVAVVTEGKRSNSAIVTDSNREIPDAGEDSGRR